MPDSTSAPEPQSLPAAPWECVPDVPAAMREVEGCLRRLAGDGAGAHRGGVGLRLTPGGG
jgi:hypothetical protein